MAVFLLLSLLFPLRRLSASTSSSSGVAELGEVHVVAALSAIGAVHLPETSKSDKT